MAAEQVWGLDVGQNALKAVKARRVGELVEILAFDHIEYHEPASGGAGDSSAAIRDALQTFLSRNDITNCQFAVSIAAGRSALIRFIKLPPVDRRKVPDIVRYEATQQIPFPLEDVIWDYQVIEREYEPGEELEVGIFAMRRDAIFNFLSNLMVSGIEVDSIQLAAAAVYNCMRYDQATEQGALLGVDIGAENTNLIIVDGNNVWTRSLPIGGNDFTRAIATKYGLEFEQAETLKRSMARSKKAKEIFEALRPSLRSLLDEVQRSAGYYRSLHKEAKFVKLIGFGNGFKMYGVKRFLEAGLAYPVEVYGRTNNLAIKSALNVHLFKKNAPGFGAALGLAVQGLGLGGINTNLMPPQILRERMLKSKRPTLIAAAAMLAGASVVYAAAAFLQPTAYPIEQDPRIRELSAAYKLKNEYENYMKVDDVKKDIEALIDVKGRKAESLAAFNALIESIPVDEQYPIYISTIAMEPGPKNEINRKLRAGWEKGTEGITKLIWDKVENRDVIDIAESTLPLSQGGRRTRQQRMAEHTRRMDELMLRMEAAREERRAAMRQRWEEIQRLEKEAGAVARRQQGVNFAGVGYLAQLTIETAHPGGPPHIREICDQMKKVRGVKHCDYYYAETQKYWEHVETHARDHNAEKKPGPDYVERNYTIAIIQWVWVPPQTDEEALTAAAEREAQREN